MLKMIFLVCALFLVACEKSNNAANRSTEGGESIDPPPQVVQEETRDKLKKLSVGLIYKNRVFCSGTIISENEVLTAAHCLGYKMKTKYGQVKIGFGLDMTQVKHTRQITEVILHDTYKKFDVRVKPYWDLAIVRFEGGLPPGYEAAPFYKGEDRDLEMQDVYMSGFGLESAFSKKHSILKTSRGRLTHLPKLGYLQGLMRVEFEKKGACFGDSGGGLFIEINGELQLIGATSGSRADLNPKVLENLGEIAVGNQDVCLLGDTTYTHLGSYAPWLNENSKAEVHIAKLPEEPSQREPKSLYDWCHQIPLTMDERIFINNLTKTAGIGICSKDMSVGESHGKLELEIDGYDNLDLNILEFLNFFSTIKISNMKQVVIPSLIDHNTLEKMVFENVSFDDISGIQYAPMAVVKFKKMKLSTQTLGYVSQIGALDELYIQDSEILDLSALGDFQQITSLEIADSGLTDISPLSALQNLQFLALGGNQIQDISALSSLGELQELYLEFNDISDISVLKDLKQLNDVSFLENPIDLSTCVLPQESVITCDDLASY